MNALKIIKLFGSSSIDGEECNIKVNRKKHYSEKECEEFFIKLKYVDSNNDKLLEITENDFMVLSGFSMNKTIPFKLRNLAMSIILKYINLSVCGKLDNKCLEFTNKNKLFNDII